MGKYIAETCFNNALKHVTYFELALIYIDKKGKDQTYSTNVDLMKGFTKQIDRYSMVDAHSMKREKLVKPLNILEKEILINFKKEVIAEVESPAYRINFMEKCFKRAPKIESLMKRWKGKPNNVMKTRLMREYDEHAYKLANCGYLENKIRESITRMLYGPLANINMIKFFHIKGSHFFHLLC